jgi:hypothetical protein
MRTDSAAGIGLLVLGIGLPAAFVFEVATRPDGTDGDNAAESLVYLQDHAAAYRLSGVCLLIAAIALLRASTAVPWRSAFTSSVGTVAAGLWALTGALRISSPGPIDHISGYDQDWGEAAYISVQMTGTQAGLLGGIALFEFWVVTGCLIAWTSAQLPRVLCLLGFVALLYPLAALVSISGVDISGAAWFIGIGSVFLGLPVWCLASGTWMLTGSRGGVPRPDPVPDRPAGP